MQITHLLLPVMVTLARGIATCAQPLVTSDPKAARAGRISRLDAYYPAQLDRSPPDLANVRIVGEPEDRQAETSRGAVLMHYCEDSPRKIGGAGSSTLCRLPHPLQFVEHLGSFHFERVRAGELGFGPDGEAMYPLV